MSYECTLHYIVILLSKKVIERYLYNNMHLCNNSFMVSIVVSPNQIQMLAEGMSYYKDLHEAGVISKITSKVASKNNCPEQVSRYHLRINLSQGKEYTN